MRSVNCNPYLDWALIDLKNAGWSSLPNQIFYPSTADSDRQEIKAMTYDVKDNTPVLVLSALRGFLKGTLYPTIKASIAWRNTRLPCPVWIVKLGGKTCTYANLLRRIEKTNHW
jgi:hypothetical protein